MLKSFSSLIDQIKHNHLVLKTLIDEYQIDSEKPLISQLEIKLNRELSTDERQTIEYAERANIASGNNLSKTKNNRSRRRVLKKGGPSSFRGWRSGKKKKKKKKGG